jgi:hypothetical protein
MPSARWTKIVIFAAAITWGFILVVSDKALDAAWAEPLGYAASAVVILLLAFDRWMWRWPLLGRLPGPPDLGGTWKTELRTTFEDRQGEVIECYIVIRQTYSTITISMLFDRSTSHSMSAELHQDGRWVLYYIYRSDKSALEPSTNPPSRGAAELTVAVSPRNHLEGDYWTDQGTKGHYKTVGHTKKVFDTFDAARVVEFS